MPQLPMITPRAEFDARKARERAKALEKYGADAVLPAGRPDYDVFDYWINELVGQVRYAEMSANRLDLMAKLLDDYRVKRLCREGRSVAKKSGEDAEQQAIYFIELRQRLIAAGLMLGASEKR